MLRIDRIGGSAATVGRGVAHGRERVRVLADFVATKSAVESEMRAAAAQAVGVIIEDRRRGAGPLNDRLRRW
jgi:hypothetical protein